MDIVQTDKMDRQTKRWIGPQMYRQTERWTDGHTGKQIDLQTHRKIGKHAERWITDIKMDRQMDECTQRQTN